jgi:hypothetical protein
MPAEPESAPKSEPEATQAKSAKRQSLPFEPKPRQGEPAKPDVASDSASKSQPQTVRMSSRAPKPKRSKAGGIPEAVSQRMMRRIAWFSGVPSLLGMSTFVVSYLAVSHDVPLPTYAVLLVSLGWFGLGVLGVSYGVMSASWDEESAGTALGVTELRTNWSRMSSAWQETREQARQEAKQNAKKRKK